MIGGPSGNGADREQPIGEAAAWCARLIDDSSDATLARFKAWYDSEQTNREAFAIAMFTAPASEALRARIASIVGQTFPTLRGAERASMPARAPMPAQQRTRPRGWRSASRRSERSSRHGQRVVGWTVVAGLAAVGAIVLTVTPLSRSLTGFFLPHAQAETLATRPGDIRSFALSDGSKVTLDGDSRVDVTIDRNQRLAHLERGRARFIVKRDPRPFRIDGGTETVTATGGVMDISLHNGIVEVTLRSGRAVASKTGNATRALSIGQTTTCCVAGGAPQPIALPVIDTSDWPTGWVEYRTVSLADLIAQANRYAKRPIVIDDPKLGELKASGRFNLIKTEQFASRIGEVFDLQVRIENDKIHLGPRS